MISVKKLSNEEEEKAADDVSWYDKEFNSDDEVEEPSDSEAGNKYTYLRLMQKAVQSQQLYLMICLSGASAVARSPAKKTVKRSRQEDDGVQYPLDVWFLISHHIQPEDICRFACICRSSHYVVHTAQFWTNLYWRFVDEMSYFCHEVIHNGITSKQAMLRLK